MWPLEISRVSASRSRIEPPLVVINAHPDPRPERFCAALALAYREGACTGGRQAEAIALGALCDEAAWKGALEHTRASSRLAVIFPLWLDKPPPLLARFFAEAADDDGNEHRAHLVITMALPGFAHRSLGRGYDFTLPGTVVEKASFVGSVDTISRSQREDWLERMREFGRRGK